MGRGQIFGRGGFLGAKSAPCKLGGFCFCWVFEFGLELGFELEDFDTMADDFSASLGRDDGKMAEGRREVIPLAPEPGLGEV